MITPQPPSKSPPRWQRRCVGASRSIAEIPAEEPIPPPRPKGLNGLKGLFGGNIRLPEFDADTVLLLVLVYFLVADETENISDTLLIIGVLLLLGF